MNELKKLKYGGYEEILEEKMEKIDKQAKVIQWYEKENRHNQEIIIKDIKELEKLKEEVENYKKVILNSTRIIDKFKETYIICFDDPLWRFVKRLEKCLKGSE